jgi:hypothetical protein
MLYHKKGEIVTRSIAGETMLVQIRARLADMEQLIVLEGIGDFVWERIDGRTDLETILSAIVDEFDVEKEVARRDLHDLISGLEKAALIEVSA